MASGAMDGAPATMNHLLLTSLSPTVGAMFEILTWLVSWDFPSLLL